MSIPGLFIRSAIAPLWAAKEGTPYLQHLRHLTNFKTRPLEQVKTDQWQRFTKLVAHAYNNTIFYRRKYDAAQITPTDIRGWDDLKKLPLLTKDDIRRNKDFMTASNINKAFLHGKSTSGSTGVAVELFIDEESLQWKRAVTITYDRWAGWDIGEIIGAMWGNPQHNLNWRTKIRNALLERYIFLDTLKIDENTIVEFYNRLKARPPAILYGHAHSIYLFAKFIEHKRLHEITPHGIISTAMVLHNFERETIERVFNCKVFNRYGCEEVSLIACECSEHNGLHLNNDTLIVEFIRDGEPVAPGEAGELVVTDLTNYGMPFIRYKVGDVGVPSTKTSCPCGCTYPLMQSIEGRVADYIVTPEGKHISGISLTDNFFSNNLLGIKQMQIVQERVDFLIFRIVKGELFSIQTVADIEKLARVYFGNRMTWVIEYVNSIQSERSGKYRFCISKLPNSFS